MTQYADVSWSDEPVSMEKLQQMATNDRYLFEATPKAAFNHEGVRRDRGLKILAGSEIVQPSNEWMQNREIRFGGFFSSGSQPIVIANHYGYPQTGANIAVKGLSETKLPSHEGFAVFMWTDDRLGNKGTLQQPMYIAYIAVGI